MKTSGIITETAKSLPQKILDLPGTILYSSCETLKPGKAYLLGYNPGGEEKAPTLNSVLSENLSRKNNAYINEEWERATLQKRIIWLLQHLELCPEEVCASNLVFIQSSGQASLFETLRTRDMNIEEVEQACWKVHEKILEIVKPAVILAFGNSARSPYAFIKNKYNFSDEVTEEAGHGNYQLKKFRASICNKEVIVAGLPHLSYYAPDKVACKKFLAELKNSN